MDIIRKFLQIPRKLEVRAVGGKGLSTSTGLWIWHVAECHSRHKMAASAINQKFAGFAQQVFTLTSALLQELLRSNQTLKTLEKLIKSVCKICTFGHFMVDFCTFGYFMLFQAAEKSCFICVKLFALMRMWPLVNEKSCHFNQHPSKC